MIAPEGEHMAHMLTWAIQQKMTALDVLQLPFYHPVVEEGMRTALRELAKKINPSKSGELLMCGSEISPGA
jgi:dihydrolipoamide dehydrogenase